MNERQLRFHKRHSAQKRHDWIVNAVIIGFVLALAFIIANAAMSAIDHRVCMQSTPDQFVKLHCEDVIK